MDDDLRTAIVEFLEPLIDFDFLQIDLEKTAEGLEKHLNSKGYAFYDERFKKPVKL